VTFLSLVSYECGVLGIGNLIASGHGGILGL
jgi:hypothetical protein